MPIYTAYENVGVPWSTPIFHLDREGRFLELSYRFKAKNGAKVLVILSFFDISARSSGIPKLFGFAYICTVMPRPVLPMLKSYFEVVDEIRL